MTKKKELVFIAFILSAGCLLALLNNATAEENQKSSSKQAKNTTCNIGCVHAGKIIVNGIVYTNSISSP